MNEYIKALEGLLEAVKSVEKSQKEMIAVVENIIQKHRNEDYWMLGENGGELTNHQKEQLH